jgi:hypothetical protein
MYLIHVDRADGRDSWGMIWREIVISNYQIQWVRLSAMQLVQATTLICERGIALIYRRTYETDCGI